MNRRWISFAAWTGALALGYWLLRLALGPLEMDWTGDGMLKMLQAHRMLTHGSTGLLLVPRDKLHAAYFPVQPPFTRRVGDGYVIVYSPSFAWLLACASRVVGKTGPWAAVALFAALGVAIARDLARRAEMAGLALGVTFLAALSPLLVHAVTASEHALATSLCLSGLLAIGRAQGMSPRWWRNLLAGLLVAVGAGLRPEVCFWLIALLVLTASRGWRATALFVAGAAAGLVLLHLSSLPGGGLGTGRRIVDFTTMAVNTGLPLEPERSLWRQPLMLFVRHPLSLLVQSADSEWVSLLALLGLLGVVLVSRTSPTIALWLAFAGCGALWVGILREGRHSVSGLFVVMPLAILALLPRDDAPRPPAQRDWFRLTVWFAVLVLVLLIKVKGGRQWGPRYLLPAVPFIAFAAADFVARVARRPRCPSSPLWPALGLVGLTVLGQLYAVRVLSSDIHRYRVLVHEWAALPQRNLVFVARWPAQIAVAAPVLEGKTCYLVDAGEVSAGSSALRVALAELGQGLAASGEQELVLCCSGEPSPPLRDLLASVVPERIPGLSLPAYRLQTAALAAFDQ